MTAMLQITDAAKTFTMHLQGGMRLPVVAGVSFRCASGRMRRAGRPVRRRQVVDPEDDLRQLSLRRRAGRRAAPGQRRRHRVGRAARHPALRKHTIGYVSQFLRAVPRVPALDVVAEPLIAERRTARGGARSAPATLLRRLNIPERLWTLPPATFSGGEQQRVNIARGFLPDLPLLLLDEPTASLDAANRAVVVDADRREEAQRRRDRRDRP